MNSKSGFLRKSNLTCHRRRYGCISCLLDKRHCCGMLDKGILNYYQCFSPASFLALTLEGFAVAHCTTCKSPYHLRVHVVGDRKCRTFKFRFFVTRDIIFIFMVVQLVIALLAYSVYLFDANQQFWLRLALQFDNVHRFYYVCGAVLFFCFAGIIKVLHNWF